MPLIDLNNYEGFLLDYSEGVLDAGRIAELRSFILSHPELQVDLGDLQLPYFAEETVWFESKEDLMKTESDLYNEELIAYLENTLDADKRINFEQQLKSDPILSAELALYRKTILSPEEEIIFEAKSDLIKTEEDLAGTEAFRLVAFVENTMNASERAAFEHDLPGNVLLRKDLDLILKTQLKAEPELIFPNKEQLKKNNRVFALYSTRTIMRMAAAILLLLTLSFLLSYYGGKETVRPASVASKKNSGHSTSAAVAADNKEHLSAPPVSELSQTTKIGRSREQKTEQAKENTPLPTAQNIAEKTDENRDPAKWQEPPLGPSGVAVEKQLAQLKPDKDFSFSKDTISTAQFYLLALEEDDDAENETAGKKGFWSRAVALAQQANKLGIKSVDGVENTRQKFRLSINNFSVEKR